MQHRSLSDKNWPESSGSTGIKKLMGENGGRHRREPWFFYHFVQENYLFLCHSCLGKLPGKIVFWKNTPRVPPLSEFLFLFFLFTFTIELICWNAIAPFWCVDSHIFSSMGGFYILGNLIISWVVVRNNIHTHHVS